MAFISPVGYFVTSTALPHANAIRCALAPLHVSKIPHRFAAVEEVVEADRSVDDREMGEDLGEVAELFAGWPDLLGE